VTTGELNVQKKCQAVGGKIDSILEKVAKLQSRIMDFILQHRVLLNLQEIFNFQNERVFSPPFKFAMLRMSCESK
jgi:hypothetical protein